MANYLAHGIRKSIIKRERAIEIQKQFLSNSPWIFDLIISFAYLNNCIYCDLKVVFKVTVVSVTLKCKCENFLRSLPPLNVNRTLNLFVPR